MTAPPPNPRLTRASALALQMWFDDFQKALESIATKKKCGVEEVRSAIVATGGPSTDKKAK